MFDVEKVCRMTDELETFVRTREELYLIFEDMTNETVALFQRLQINFRAIISDQPLQIAKIDENSSFPLTYEAFFKLPVLKTSDAAKNFNERTGIIVIVEKPLAIFQTELPFDVNGRRLNVPTFILSLEEISVIYCRLIIMETLRLYREDGLPMPDSVDMALRFACGLKTFLPLTQTFKFQLLNEKRFNFRYDLSDTAIVIQGPIVYDNNYTADTLKFYRTIYPNVPIVVSTWQGEATDDFRVACRENSVALLENKPPDFAGPFNVNMQLESSLQGVKFIRENTDAKFVLKTRCDQRINKPDFLTWFRNLILTFPPFGDKLRGRILFAQALKWFPFRTADFLAFGYVEDIAKLYGISRLGAEKSPVVYRKRHWVKFNYLLFLIDRCKWKNYIPPRRDKLIRQINGISRRIHEVETHILKTFYEENIGTIDYDKFLETGWKFMRDYLVIVGLQEISLDWPKYETLWNYSVDGGLHANEIDFARWLDLYRNFKLDWI